MEKDSDSPIITDKGKKLISHIVALSQDFVPNSKSIDIKNDLSVYVDMYYAHKVTDDEGNVVSEVNQCVQCGRVYVEQDTACMCCVNFDIDMKFVTPNLEEINDEK